MLYFHFNGTLGSAAEIDKKSFLANLQSVEVVKRRPGRHAIQQ